MKIFIMTLLAALTLIVVCIISIRRNRPRQPREFQPIDIISLFDASKGSKWMDGGYPLRTFIRDNRGRNHFIRFSIVRRYWHYRAYIESDPSFNSSYEYEAMGFQKDAYGRYYLNSRTTSAANCEAFVRRWAESFSEHIEFSDS